jgi:phenylacetate-CoA ligase
MTGAGFRDREEIERKQLVALQAMIPELLSANRFYQRKLASAGVTQPPGSLQEYSTRVPFTTKPELVEDQRAEPPFGTNLTYPLERYTRFHQTSGTTGVPMRWLDTAADWCWMVDNWAEVMHVSGVTPADRIFFAFSFGPFLGFWTAFDAGERLGCLCLSGGGMSSAARLRMLLDNEATVLCCTPTYALRLGEVAAEEGIDLSRSAVRILLVAGEAGAAVPSTRARIERTWPGARVCDHHGMTEIGPVTFECPARPGVLHVMERGYIAEVIGRETGREVAPGGHGELVLTNLGRWGSPLLRYRTGDLVRRAAEVPCACGRFDMALEGGILGRTDDMVVVRGVNVYPTALEEAVRRFDAVAEYRVQVLMERAMPELRVHLEPAPECPDPGGLKRDVETALRVAFNLRIPVELAEPGSLPRFELKAKRWVHVRRGPGDA